MALKYPPELPRQFLARLAAAEADAQVSYCEAIEKLRRPHDVPVRATNYLTAGMEYVTAVTLACAEQALAASWQGHVGLEKIGEIVDTFLESAAEYVFSDLGLETQWDDFEVLVQQSRSALNRSADWHEHLVTVSASIATESDLDPVNPKTTSAERRSSPGTSRVRGRRPATGTSPEDTKTPESSNRERVNAYIAEVFEKTGVKLTRKQIWKDAGYGHRSEFERWQRHDKRTTDKARTTFEDLLRLKLHLREKS